MKKTIHLALVATLLLLTVNIAKAENAKYEENANDARRTELRRPTSACIFCPALPHTKWALYGRKLR